jgi:hypothetical protein
LRLCICLTVAADREQDNGPIPSRLKGGSAVEKETAMPSPNPVHALLAKLETERLSLVQKLAQSSALSADALKELATLQAALTAVSEEIEAHGPKLGWGSEKELK